MFSEQEKTTTNEIVRSRQNHRDVTSFSAFGRPGQRQVVQI